MRTSIPAVAQASDVDEQGKVWWVNRRPAEAEPTPAEIQASPTRSPENPRRRAKTRRLHDATESGRAQAQAEAARAEAAQARNGQNSRSARDKGCTAAAGQRPFLPGTRLGEALLVRGGARTCSEPGALFGRSSGVDHIGGRSIVQMNPVANRIRGVCVKIPGDGGAPLKPFCTLRQDAGWQRDVAPVMITPVRLAETAGFPFEPGKRCDRIEIII